MEFCKSRLRLSPMLSLLRQGFPHPAYVSSGGSNSSLHHWRISFADAGSRLRERAHRADAINGEGKELLRESARTV